MARDRLREFRKLTYRDPRATLVELRRVEALVVASDASPKIKNLRTQELKPLRELREACLFCHAWGQVNKIEIGVAHVEKQDYDAVATWIEGDEQNFAPIQIKEVVPQDLNPATSVQAVVDSLTKYSDSRELTVVVHLNQVTTFSPSELVIPRLNIAALWVYAALTSDQSRWAIWGNFLDKWSAREFTYPM